MRKTFYTILFCSIIITSFAQKSEDNFRKVCFCSVGVAHPYSILRLDNNWELLFAFESGKSLKELDSLNIDYSESQIALLKLWKLIEKIDGKYYTSIPFYTEPASTELRAETRQIAKNINRLIQDDYNSFKQIIENRKIERNTFSIFFAFVLDDLVWQVFSEKGLMKKVEVTKENPFWDGTMWVIQPKRDFSCGTNSMKYENLSIGVNNLPEKSDIEVSDYKLLKKMLKDYKENGIITDKEIIQTFSKNDLFNSSGELLIPIIKADSTDVLFNQSDIIANKVANYLIENLEFERILTQYSFEDKEQAILVLYHEIMWDMLEIMEENGQLLKPIAFDKSKKATQKDLRDLIFIVEN